MVMVIGVPAAVVLDALAVPTWAYLICAIVFGLLTWRSIQRAVLDEVR